MKAIIAGGRDYIFTLDDYEWLVDLLVIPGDCQEVVTGGARGADTEAVTWAEKWGLPVHLFPADWQQHGRAAGPIRNRQMLDYAGADALVVLFPGGRGTADMRKQALARGLRVIEAAKASR